MWFCLSDIAQTTPTEKSNRSSHSHGRDFTAAFAFDCNLLKSLTRWDCVPVILAKSSRRKSRYRTGLLTRCEIVFKALLAGFEFAKKRTAAKALQMRRLSAFAFEAITLLNFEKKMNEANASVKTKYEKKKLAIKNARLKDEAATAACCSSRMCDT